MGAHRIVIFADQNGFAGLGFGGGAIRLDRRVFDQRLFLIETRQRDADHRALAGARLDADMATRLANEAIDHRKTKPSAFADVLGGEERLEHPRQGRVVHSETRVGDR